MDRSEFKEGARMIVDSRYGNRFEAEVEEIAVHSIKIKVGKTSSWYKFDGSWYDSQNVGTWTLVEYLKEKEA